MYSSTADFSLGAEPFNSGFDGSASFDLADLLGPADLLGLVDLLGPETTFSTVFRVRWVRQK